MKLRTALLLVLALAAPAFAASNQNVVEGNSGLTIVRVTFTIPAPVNLPVTGHYETVDGTATAADNDYQPVSGDFVIPSGQTSSEPVDIPIVGDTKVESDETFQLVLSNIQNGAELDPGPYSFTIVNDDAPVISVTGTSVREGNSGTTALPFDIVLGAPAATPLQIAYTTIPGTATAGEDYVPANATVTFAPGEVRKTVNVTVIGDTRFEPDETLTLVAAQSGLPPSAPASAVGTIINDDTRPAASLTIVSGNNQSGRLGQPLAQPLVVQVNDAAGAPVAGATVQWSVTRGAAQLDPATSTTNAEGRASTIVTPNSVGAIDIRASSGDLPPVTFTIAAQTTLEARANGPVAKPIAHVLDGVCARNEEPFTLVCRALERLPDTDLTPALERIAPQQAGAQSKIAGEIIANITASLSARLAERRAGARFSLQHASLSIGGQPVPVAIVANALLEQTGTGAATGDANGDDYNGWSAFVSGNLGTGERRASSGALGFDLDTSGVMVGVDRQFGENIFGLSANAGWLDATLSAGTGTVDTTNYALSLYGSRGGLFAGSAAPSTGTSMHYDGVHLEGSLTAGRSQFDATHIVSVPLLPSSTAHSSNDATLFALTAGGGVDAHRGRTDFDFALSGTWSRTRIDDLAESDAGPLVLFVDGHDIESLVANAGLDVRSAIAVPFGTLMPTFRGELVHEFRSAARLVTAHFLHDHLGTGFTIPVDQPDANYGKLSAGLQAVFPRGVSAFVEVTQDVARSDLRFRTLQFNLSKSF
ncbi:MAG: autotransporter domain-containing protein [Acidobacteria bacterium]|nr:autotransporter domain-containing protein [Acidobacteriota bacterium]MBV9479109.1 autotransporter domain-containing protein [Acidobacteriota bacterium]